MGVQLKGRLRVRGSRCYTRTGQKMVGRFGSGEQRGVADKRAVVFVIFGSCICYNSPLSHAILNGGPVYKPLTPRFVQVFVVDTEEVWLMLADCSRICRRR